MNTASVSPITKNLSTEEAVERGYRLLTAALNSPMFHHFVSKQIDSSSDGPEAVYARTTDFLEAGSDVKQVLISLQGRSRWCSPIHLVVPASKLGLHSRGGLD